MRRTAEVGCLQQEILMGAGSEMRSGFDPEGAASNGLQIGRQQQLLLLLLQQQQQEEEKNGCFELDNGPLYNTQSCGSSSCHDCDSTLNGNYMFSSKSITDRFYTAERSGSGLELPRQLQQLQPALDDEIYSLNNLHHDATANYCATADEFRDHSFLHIQNAANSFNLDGHRRIFDQNSFVGSPDMPSGIAAFMPSSSSPIGNLTTEPGPESTSPEDSEIFSDMLLKYINGILMEDDIEDKFDIYPEHPALLAAEKPFYDILGEKFPPAADEPLPYFRSNQESLDDGAGNYFENFNRIGDAGLMGGSSHRPGQKVAYHQLQRNHDSLNYSSASCAYKNCAGSFIHGMENYPSGLSTASELFPAWQFHKGLEEAHKPLPSDNKLVSNLVSTGFHMPQEPNEGRKEDRVKPKDGETKRVTHLSRRKKSHNDADLDVQEGRTSKQSAAYTEETIRTKMFDEILLSKAVHCDTDICEPQANLNVDSSKSLHITHSKGSGSWKGRGKRLQQPIKQVVDLQTLLINCAQCVSIDDQGSAYMLLKQIRKHADPHGDANQRLAHYFADGLEDRLAGTGGRIYHSLVMKRIPITDVLKAYKLHMNASPFKRIGYYFSNQTILDVAEKATRLHIIDFGVYYGFQWPCFMQQLCNRPGGPPKLRITAIDTPAAGFRPAVLIDETGRRLTDYAQSFNIPFEYHGIATRWETIREEDLNIDKDEPLIVNCMFRMKSVAGEMVLVDSPRDVVLNLIRKLNPAVFIHGIVNGSYNAPFFLTRFREALFYFSALYDLIETTVPREDESRQLIEKVIYGREALNVISCEGSERVERPETYKQWQVRNLRAGFVQLPLNPAIFSKARAKYKASYHKDFVIDTDNKWLLQGWKGKILCALSTWKPNISS